MDPDDPDQYDRFPNDWPVGYDSDQPFVPFDPDASLFGGRPPTVRGQLFNNDFSRWKLIDHEYFGSQQVLNLFFDHYRTRPVTDAQIMEFFEHISVSFSDEPYSPILKSQLNGRHVRYTSKEFAEILGISNEGPTIPHNVAHTFFSHPDSSHLTNMLEQYQAIRGDDWNIKELPERKPSVTILTAYHRRILDYMRSNLYMNVPDSDEITYEEVFILSHILRRHCLNWGAIIMTRMRTVMDDRRIPLGYDLVIGKLLHHLEECGDVGPSTPSKPAPSTTHMFSYSPSPCRFLERNSSY